MENGDESGIRDPQTSLKNIYDKLSPLVSAIGTRASALKSRASLQRLDHLLADINPMCKASGKLSEVMEGLIDGKTAKTLCSDTDIRKFQKNLRHDLRNPISAIKGYGEMLLEDLQDPGVEALRSEIVTLLDEVQFLLSQLYEIVEFSSPAQGRGGQPLEGASSHSMTHVEAPAGVRSAGGGARRFESGKILVVDDIEENRELLVRRLSHEGHDVKAAESGEKALQLLHSQKFELVLLDVVMPDMDGYEVLARIKGDNGLRDIPVVMVSSWMKWRVSSAVSKPAPKIICLNPSILFS